MAVVAEIGTDVATVATKTLHSAIETTQDTSNAVGSVAKSAALGVVTGSSEVGNAVVHGVRDVLVGAVEGVKDVLGAILPRAAATPALVATVPGAASAPTPSGMLSSPSQTRRTEE